MGITPAHYPRWLRELLRHLPLKTLFFVYGNVNDTLPYPIVADEQERWTMSSISQVLFDILLKLQRPPYEIVGAYDFVDGLSFADAQHANKMAPLFAKIEAQQSSNRSSSDATSGSEEDKTDRMLDRFRLVLSNRQHPVAMILEHASQLTSSPNSLQSAERSYFVKLLKLSRGSQPVGVPTADGKKTLLNVLILVCEKITDIPAWLYLNNPFAKCIEVEMPRPEDRRRFFEEEVHAFFEGDAVVNAAVRRRDGSLSAKEQTPGMQLSDAFVDLTEGLSNRDLINLRTLSRNERISIGNVKQLVELLKYGTKESMWDKINPGKLRVGEEKLRQSVKGQDAAIALVMDVLRRARLGLSGMQHSSASSKPRGILFFAGPTGVGKTEMAKAVAEVVFGSREACVRFDMSEYAQPHSDQKLLGAPPGYVGYDSGGQLTNRVKQNPFCLLLFDEIEKAHPSILDKFLQILEDGRMTDGQGETVYFSETIIVFTSNIGTQTLDPSVQSNYQEVKDKILEGIRHYFTHTLGRPELLNRFGNNFVIFDFIREEVMSQIVDKVLSEITRQVHEKRKLSLVFRDDVKQFVMSHCLKNLEQGGRGVGNFIEISVLNPLSRVISEGNYAEGSDIVISRIVENANGSASEFSVEVTAVTEPAIR